MLVSKRVLPVGAQRDAKEGYSCVIGRFGMFDLTRGEWVILCFILTTVVTAAWWPRLGAAIGARFAGPNERPADKRQDGDS
jgi:hypothetical protein